MKGLQQLPKTGTLIFSSSNWVVLCSSYICVSKNVKIIGKCIQTTHDLQRHTVLSQIKLWIEDHFDQLFISFKVQTYYLHKN